MHVKVGIVLSEKVMDALDDEWQDLLALAARIPQINREIVDVIGWEFAYPLFAVRMQTMHEFVYFTRDPIQGWKVNRVYRLSGVGQSLSKNVAGLRVQGNGGSSVTNTTPKREGLPGK